MVTFITVKEIARKLALDVTAVKILNYIKRLGLSLKKLKVLSRKRRKYEHDFSRRSW